MVINRRRIALAGCIALAGANRVGLAQGGRTPVLVGVITASGGLQVAPYIDALKQGMLELGWKEGVNIEYRVASANGDPRRWDELVAGMLSAKVDVMLVSSTAAAAAAQQASKSIPIVTAIAIGVQGAGLVDSLAKPGRNVTGLVTQFEDFAPKLVQLLHEIAPRAKRVAVVMTDRNPNYPQVRDSLLAACERLKLEVVPFIVSVAAEIVGLAARIGQRQCQAIIVASDSLYVANRAMLQQELRTTNLPSGFAFREHVVEGGLFSYGVSITGAFRQSAQYVDKILKGARPGDLPVQQPTAFELAVNLRTAAALGLTVPRSVLLTANELIE